MPPLAAFAGGFLTTLTAGAVAFGAPTAAFAAGVAVATAVGSTLVTGALVLGANILSRALASESQGVNSPEVRGSIRQATPTRRIPYGYVRTGGAVFFLDDTKPPYIYVGLLLSARRVSGVIGYKIGDKAATFNPYSFETLTADFITATGPMIHLSFRDGDPNQLIDPLLAQDFPHIAPTFRQRGHATVFFRAKYGVDIDEFERLWGQVQIPNVLVDLAGAPIHDPRNPVSDPDDETTWTFGRTAALVQADYLRQNYGGRVPTSKMRWDEIADAANYDDQPVEKKDGTVEKRYTIDGVVNLDQPPLGVMQSMLGANRGFVCSHQGRLWVTSSKPQDAVLTITDKDLRGGFEYRQTSPKTDLINKVRTRFVPAEREYQTADGPILVRSDLETLDGETLEATLGLPFTQSSSAAQRLATIALEETRLQKGLTCNLPVKRCLGLRPGQKINVESTLYPFMSGSYLSAAVGIADGLNLMPVTLIEYNATLPYEWAAADEQDFKLAALEVS